MRVIFDKYGKIVGTPTTDDYWGQGDDLTTYLEAQFLDDNDTPIVFSSDQYVECVVERPDKQISPALLMSKINDAQSNLTVAQLTITNWITEVAGKLKFNIRLKETLGGTVTTKVTGICYRVIGQAIDPADQTITDAQYQALMDAFNSKEDVANKAQSMVGNQNSTTKYPSMAMLYNYIKDRIVLIDTPFESMALLEAALSNGSVGVFGATGIYSVNVSDGTKYDKAIVLINSRSGNYGYHATIVNGSFIEMLTGTILESGPSAGHLGVPGTQKKFDLNKIGLSNNGTLSGLSTTDKTTLVAAINEIVSFLGSTSGGSLVGFDSSAKTIVACLNEAREMIRQIVAGGLPSGEAQHATNATNDEDGNRIKTTYAKLWSNNEFHGLQTFLQGGIDAVYAYIYELYVNDDSTFEGDVDFNGTVKVTGNIIIPLAVNSNNAVRKDQLDQLETDLLTGTKTVNKSTNDAQGNTIHQHYGHSIRVISDTTNHIYTFQLLDAIGTVLNQEVIDLPIESLVVNGSYDSVNQKIILTLQNGNTIEIPIGALIGGLQTEITNDNKLSSDLVDDTNHINKFVSAVEKAQITTNKEDIAALEARVDDYSYASMVYDAEDESIVVTGIALSYDGSDEELIIVR